MKRVLAAGILIVLAVIAAVVVLRPPAVPVETAQVSRQTVRGYIVEDGKTRLPTHYVVDMPVSGTVGRIACEIGDPVARDQLLARIDPFDLQQGVRSAEAQVAEVRAQVTGVDVSKPKPEDIEVARVRVREAADAEAMAKKQFAIAEINRDNARKEYERIKNLLARGAVSQSAFDAAELNYKSLAAELDRAKLAQDSAGKAREAADLQAKRLVASVDDNEYLRKAYQSQIESLEAGLKAQQNDLAKTEVRSPIAGVVLEKIVEGDRVLPAGSPLLVVGNLDEVEIESDILSEEVVRIRVGNPVEITGKALEDRTVNGEVKRIYPAGFKKISALGIEQQRVKIIVGFDNATLQLRPETSVDVRVITEAHDNVVAILERAAFRRENQWAVFVVRDGKAVLAPVTIGLKNDQWAEILAGIEPGETIVAEPRNELADGVRVKPIE